MPFCVSWGTYSMLLANDCLNHSGDKLSHTSSVLSKPSAVNQVVVAAIVISSNTYYVWTMFLCIDSVKFILEEPSAKTLTGRF